MQKIILIIALIIAGCASNNLTGNAILEQTPKEIIPNPEIHFCPKDNCEDILVQNINRSSKSIHCAFYDIDLEKALETLSEKSKEIDVKLVIDNTNWDSQFKGKGIIVDTNSQLMHNKFCVFDNEKILTGSFNPTYNDAFKNNNNVLIIKSKTLANNYELEFQELWNYNFGKGHQNPNKIIYLNNKKYTNLFCPEDQCKLTVLSTLDKAEKSIYFMIFSFTDKDIANMLIEKEKQGLDVRGVTEAKRVNMEYEQYNHLKDSGINILKDSNPNTLHHKVFIIDNETVITGSYNPTKSADEKNDENILIISDKDIANQFTEEFFSIYIE